MELTIDQALQQGVAAHKEGKYQDAERLYRAILQSQPEHPDANHNLGLLAVAFNKTDLALPLFKTALEANPKIEQFWLSYIDTLIKEKQFENAKQILEQAKNRGAKGDGFHKIEKRLDLANKSSTQVPNVEDPPQNRLQTLINLYKQGQFEKAFKGASQLQMIYPNSAILYNIAGVTKQGLGKLDEVIRAYNKAILIKPDNAEAFNNMGNALRDQGKLEEAIKAYNEAISIKPSYAEAYNNLGNALKDQNRLNQVIAAYNKALIIKPNLSKAYNNIGNALKDQGKPAAAIASYNKAVSIRPDYAEAYNNMGNALKDQGKIDQAIAASNKGLIIKPNLAGAYNSRGAALKDRGKLGEALKAYNKAISIKIDYAEAYSNMGNLLRIQGEFSKAIASYNKATSIWPGYAEAYNNMGNALKDQGKIDQAIASFNKAISIRPDYAEAYNNIGVVFHKEGKLTEAIASYNTAISIKADYAEAYNNMGIALPEIVFKKPNRSMQDVITIMLENSTSADPSGIANAAVSLLKLEANFQKILELANSDTLKQNPADIILQLNQFPLLLQLMKVCPIPDLEIEKLLKNLRASILKNIFSLKEISNKLLIFQSALALQCFTNEYIYKQTKEEEKCLQVIEKSVKNKLEDNGQPEPQEILILASYKMLNQYDWSHLLIVADEIQEVFTRQKDEPEKENDLKSQVPALEEITDNISLEVRKQYEENPYPRWVNLHLRLKPEQILKVVDESKLKIYDKEIISVESPSILIAGCGTGQHSISSAACFKSSKVLAIDLSLSSLSYAQRKSNDLNVKNVEYMQADILTLGGVKRQFDIIECSGVLHHMDDPMTGWKALVDCLKPSGLMNIGLYSELARQDIVKIRQEINQAGIGSSDAEMKFFREAIIGSDKEHHKMIRTCTDFYSLSMFRDLLFHIKEHRFTIPRIKDYLDELGLKFCGFGSTKIVLDFKLKNGHKDQYNLDEWHLYEEANPNTFAEMYQFWCQKVN